MIVPRNLSLDFLWHLQHLELWSDKGLGSKKHKETQVTLEVRMPILICFKVAQVVLFLTSSHALALRIFQL